MINKIYIFAFFAIVFVTTGCISTQLALDNPAAPLEEFVLKEYGDYGHNKIAVIPIVGEISSAAKSGFFGDKPSMLQEFVSQLNKAETDDDVHAIIIKINSPGGGVTPSDIMYNEIIQFQKRTKKKIVVCMMDVAASGGYYTALPADYIFAHPTTITGSVGVIFMRPKISEVCNKIGVDMEITKSGKFKDMGSMFRKSEKEELELFQNLVKTMAKRFESLVTKHRKISKENLAEVLTAKVVLPKKALKLGLIDEIGYFSDAVLKAQKLANIANSSKVIVYRRKEYANDNIYNDATMKLNSENSSLINIDFFNKINSQMKPGFYYLWTPSL